MSSEKIGLFIKKCRKDLKLTQEELGEKLGVSSKSISRWENNITMPDLSLISSIAEILNVEVSELLNGRKMNEEELLKLRETIDKVINYSKYEEKTLIKRLNKSFVIKIVLLCLALINNHFNVIGCLFNENVQCSVNNILIFPVLIIILIDFYKNRHNYDFKVKDLILTKKSGK